MSIVDYRNKVLPPLVPERAGPGHDHRDEAKGYKNKACPTSPASVGGIND